MFRRHRLLTCRTLQRSHREPKWRTSAEQRTACPGRTTLGAMADGLLHRQGLSGRRTDRSETDPHRSVRPADAPGLIVGMTGSGKDRRGHRSHRRGPASQGVPRSSRSTPKERPGDHLLLLFDDLSPASFRALDRPRGGAAARDLTLQGRRGEGGRRSATEAAWRTGGSALRTSRRCARRTRRPLHARVRVRRAPQRSLQSLDAPSLLLRTPAEEGPARRIELRWWAACWDLLKIDARTRCKVLARHIFLSNLIEQAMARGPGGSRWRS